jgi:hypothetical protein
MLPVAWSNFEPPAGFTTPADGLCVPVCVSVLLLLLQAGATAAFLRELLLSPLCTASAAVEADMQRCLEMHFKDMPQLLPEQPGKLPADCLERLQPQPASTSRQVAA